MNRGEIARRIRSYTRDLSGSIFRTIDVNDYINEGIDRVRSRVPECAGMQYVNADEVEPTHLPPSFHYLLSVYAASRCFGQDERHYQASTLMNEFEVKLDELIALIEEGKIVIVDGDGNAVEDTSIEDHVRDVYFNKRNYQR